MGVFKERGGRGILGRGFDLGGRWGHNGKNVGVSEGQRDGANEEVPRSLGVRIGRVCVDCENGTLFCSG